MMLERLIIENQLYDSFDVMTYFEVSEALALKLIEIAYQSFQDAPVPILGGKTYVCIQHSNDTWFVKLSYIDEFGDRKYKTKGVFRVVVMQRNGKMIFSLNYMRENLQIIYPILSEHYIEWYSKRRKSSSIKMIKNYVKNHLDPYFKKMNVYRMITKDILKFHDHMTEKLFRGRPLKKDIFKMYTHA